MITDVRCCQCSEKFPAHVVAQFGGMCPACVAGFAELPAPEEKLLKAGATFGRYEILDVLGRGGMGVVYRARQPDLDRVVALKILSPRLAADRSFVERFGHEAKALARLNHPNIVAVHDCGVEAGTPYLAMEYVEGENLRRLMAERRLKPERALAIVPQLCDALEYAHGQGVIHRDIKPENILSDRRGRVKIADFGLAMMIGAGAPRLTQTNAVMGTPHYMAPEQVENPKTVDHRADIYSMGVVFYEMLTGELPLGAFSKPSEKAEVHRRIDEIILRALAKEPARRYQTASEVKSDLVEAPRKRDPVRTVEWGIEWKSQTSVKGWPLVHIAYGLSKRGLPVVARGIIAIGNIAVGGVAIGGLSLGLISLGGLGLGLLLALGGLAIGGVSFGGGAVGGIAVGGGAFGYYATGGGAWGRYVIGANRIDPEAEEFFPEWMHPSISDAYSEGMKAFRSRDYARAERLLMTVPESHPRYTTAIATVCYDIDTKALGRTNDGTIALLNYVRQKRPNDPALEAVWVKVLDAYQKKRQSKVSPREPAEDLDTHQMVGESRDFAIYVAEDAMKKIEEAIVRARTIRLDFRGTYAGHDISVKGFRDFKGTLLIAGRSKASLVWDEPVEGKSQLSRSVSDGSRAVYETEGTSRSGTTSELLQANLAYAISTTGFQYAFLVAGSMRVDPKIQEGDLRNLFRRYNLRLGSRDGANETLTYTVISGGAHLGDVKLWYDPATYKIVKRTIRVPEPAGGGVLEETYTCAFDEQISETQFDLGLRGR